MMYKSIDETRSGVVGGKNTLLAEGSPSLEISGNLELGLE